LQFRFELRPKLSNFYELKRATNGRPLHILNLLTIS
jgi:hypothetical protein